MVDISTLMLNICITSCGNPVVASGERRQDCGGCTEDFGAFASPVLGLREGESGAADRVDSTRRKPGKGDLWRTSTIIGGDP
jgi:hypothetical protein